jgi:hypothetical protein
MEKKNITITVDPKASKQEEMDILIKLRKSFEGTGCYLEGLFSKALIEWATPRIRDDGSIDVMEELESREQQVIKSEQKGVALLKDQEDTLREKEALIRQLNDHNVVLENEIGHKLAQLMEDKEQYQALEEKLKEERYKTAAQATEITSLKQEIVNLKAKLYDMMVAAN